MDGPWATNRVGALPRQSLTAARERSGEDFRKVGLLIRRRLFPSGLQQEPQK